MLTKSEILRVSIRLVKQAVWHAICADSMHTNTNLFQLNPSACSKVTNSYKCAESLVEQSKQHEQPAGFQLGCLTWDSNPN